MQAQSFPTPGRFLPPPPGARLVLRGHPQADLPTRERRRQPRHRVAAGTFAVISKQSLALNHLDRLSLGEIALAIFKNRPVRIGPVIDMGPGGASFTSPWESTAMDPPLTLDFVFAERALHLPNMPYHIVSVEPLPPEPPFSGLALGRMHLCFPAIPGHCRQSLDRFIAQAAKEDRTWKKHLAF